MIYEGVRVRMGALVCRNREISQGKTRGENMCVIWGVCMAGKFPDTSCSDMHDSKK